MREIYEYVNKFKQEHKEEIEQFNPANLEIITISRSTGCGGLEIAQKLGEKLGYSVWDKEIMLSICENIDLSKARAALLEEKKFATNPDFANEIFGFVGLNQYTYKKELIKLVYDICMKNKAIIVGRGANFFIPGALHIRLEADINKRISKVAEDLHSSRIYAKDFVIKTDKLRQKFLYTNFGKSEVENFQYDLTINTDNFSYDDIVEIITKTMEIHKNNLQNYFLD